MTDRRDKADAGSEEAGGWLLLIYRVPPEPTRLRSTVWRRIKSLGAIYLQNSVAALPAGPAAERSLRKLRREILDMSGTAVLLSCAVLAGETEVRNAFQTARDDEYEEIVDKCEDFLRQVQKEYDENHFTYAELEENEVDLVKLRNWFAKVTDRDVGGGGGEGSARTAGRRPSRPLTRASSRLRRTPPASTPRKGKGSDGPMAISLIRPHLLSRMPCAGPR